MARIDHTTTAAAIDAQLDEHIEGALEDTRDLLISKGATPDELASAMEWQREQWAAWRVRVVPVAQAALTDPAAGHARH